MKFLTDGDVNDSGVNVDPEFEKNEDYGEGGIDTDKKEQESQNLALVDGEKEIAFQLIQHEPVRQLRDLNMRLASFVDMIRNTSYGSNQKVMMSLVLSEEKLVDETIIANRKYSALFTATSKLISSMKKKVCDDGKDEKIRTLRDRLKVQSNEIGILRGEVDTLNLEKEQLEEDLSAKVKNT
ncbi:uncharacterized protein LOC144435391 [Glandiceps talaboti]